MKPSSPLAQDSNRKHDDLVETRIVRRSERLAVKRRRGPDKDRLDEVTIAQAEKEFSGRVFRAKHADNFGLVEEILRELNRAAACRFAIWRISTRFS